MTWADAATDKTRKTAKFEKLKRGHVTEHVIVPDSQYWPLNVCKCPFVQRVFSSTPTKVENNKMPAVSTITYSACTGRVTVDDSHDLDAEIGSLTCSDSSTIIIGGGFLEL